MKNTRFRNRILMSLLGITVVLSGCSTNSKDTAATITAADSQEQTDTTEESESEVISKPAEANTSEATTEAKTETETTDEREAYEEEIEESETAETQAESETETEAETTAETATESETTQTKPAETKPAETKPVETEPAETKPAETKPAETKPEIKIKKVEATVRGDHYVGDTLTVADITVIVSYSDNTTVTNPAGFTAAPLTLSGETNEITVSYKGVSTVVTVKAAKKHVHQYGEWKTVKAANCGNAGKEERSCSCGAKETRDIPVNGQHEYGDWVVTNEATHRSVGYRYRKCKHCGDTQGELIPAKGFTQDDLTKIENDLEVLINQARKQEGWVKGGLVELWDAGPKAREYARLRAYEQTIKFGHSGPNGEFDAIMFDSNGNKFLLAEAAVGFNSSAETAQDLMDYIKNHPSSHYADICSRDACGISVGLYYDKNTGYLYLCIVPIEVIGEGDNTDYKTCPVWNENTFKRCGV